jgi:hypothetical protein
MGKFLLIVQVVGFVYAMMKRGKNKERERQRQRAFDPAEV